MADLEFLSFLTLRLETSNRFHTPNEVSLVQKEGVPLWSHPSHHKLMAAGPCPTDVPLVQRFLNVSVGPDAEDVFAPPRVRRVACRWGTFSPTLLGQMKS